MYLSDLTKKCYALIFRQKKELKLAPFKNILHQLWLFDNFFDGKTIVCILNFYKINSICVARKF